MTFQIAQIQTIPEVLAIAKIGVLSLGSFFLAMMFTPVITHFLYKYKIGIKIKKNSVDGDKLSYVNKMHAHKSGTPTMGGVLIWGTVSIMAFLVNVWAPFFSDLFDLHWIGRLNFVSRSQTWLPLFALISTAILGLFDDYMSIKKIGSNKGGGMSFFWRLAWIILIAFLGAWWFYYKLNWNSIHIPAIGDFVIDLWYLPLFVFIITATTVSSNETDGLDGLNAGILIQAFTAFAIIAFFKQMTDLATFCGVIAGSLTAFLWFNFYPARFFMGDTGAVSLGATLGVVAMLTDSVLVLPFLVVIYVIESSSVIIQLTSKRFFNKKVFLSAPIHHHFEAIGWPETKVTVRFWIINGVFATLGVLIGIIGGGV